MGIVSLSGVFGTLDLYGMPHNVYRTKLASTAQAGSNSISLQEPVDWQVSSLHRFSLLISTSEQNTGVKSHVFRFSTILTILHEGTWGDKWKVRLSTCSVPFALVWKTCSGWFCVCFPPLFKISLKCV